VASFEIQFQSLCLLGSHRQRGEILMKTKSVATSLLKTLEAMEQEVIDVLQDSKTEELRETTECMEMINIAREHFPKDSLLSEVSKLLKNNQPHIVSTLGKEEEVKTKIITQRFSEMKKKVNHLLSRINDL
jgi:iron-sulfur cluster repair protein YtfE (RIC family)